MNTGLYLPNFGSWGDPTAMVSLATDAEASGWDGFFIWDHIGGFKNTMVDPWVALGAVAQAITTITIGTTVTPVPRRRPQKLARETTTVDQLSGGRFVFGIGSGEGAPEFDNMGENTVHRERGAMLDAVTPYERTTGASRTTTLTGLVDGRSAYRSLPSVCGS